MATNSVTSAGTSPAIQALLDSVNTSSGTTASKSTTNAAQDRFLKLLTTQLKNQDPLNPLDNAQMTSQLAQISTVDGIEKLNATLQQILANNADAQTMQAAALVGKTVMVAGNNLTLTSAGAVGGVELASAADQVTVTIKDANGLVVKTLNLGSRPAGVNDFSWDGTNDAGTAAVAGNYSISVAAKQGQDKVTAAALQLAQVNSVARDAQGLSLDMGALGKLSLADIKQLF